MIIVISGSVGTGKTTIAKELAKKLKSKYIDVTKLIKDNKLKGKYLKEFDSYEIDVKKLNKILVELVKTKKDLVIDSHLSHYLAKKYVGYCVICKCNIKTLKKRLKSRKYSEIKIRENLDSEIFDVCLVEALDNKHKVIVIDTTRKRVNSCVREILEQI